MITQKIYLKEHFPELGQNGCNAYVECYVPSAFQNAGAALATKKYPCILVCPGGAYSGTSDREAESVAMQFVAEGYRAVVVRYSCRRTHFLNNYEKLQGRWSLYINMQKTGI